MKKKLFASFLCFTLLLSVNLFLHKKSEAYGIAPGFGGPILFTFPCLNGLLLTVGPPAPGQYLLSLSSRIYMMFDPSIGQRVVGNYMPGVCVLPPPFASFPVPMILNIGTS